MAGKQTSSSNIDNEDTSSESSQSPVDDAEMERGWIAWQEEWARTMGRGRLPGFTRTMSLSESEKQDRDEGGDSEEETVFSSIRSSHSSVVTAVSESSGCGSRHPSGGYSKTGKPPVSDPALWETEHGQKWSDRFQFLVHNFQAAAGKHTRRLADIIPKGSRRWTKKSRARSIPTEAVQMTPSSGEVV
ncbi:hypothetical protein BGZ94_008052 [Podila epigama]|nr:hypothetical protein BGZ94_008052 [Podila epigama]